MPTQVLLTEDGQAKIADMGMSRCQAGNAPVTAQAIMTPIWSAPEVGYCCSYFLPLCQQIWLLSIVVLPDGCIRHQLV